MMDKVRLVRTLRDGSQSFEVMPRWLAEMVIYTIPHEEPNTAKAKIEPLSTPDTRDYRQGKAQDWRMVALNLCEVANGFRAGLVA